MPAFPQTNVIPFTSPRLAAMSAMTRTESDARQRRIEEQALRLMAIRRAEGIETVIPGEHAGWLSSLCADANAERTQAAFDAQFMGETTTREDVARNGSVRGPFSPASFFRIGGFGVSVGLVILATIVVAYADEPMPPAQTKPVFDQVLTLLREEYPSITFRQEYPRVVRARLVGKFGETSDGVVKIDERAPLDCVTRIVSHEAAHWYLGRDMGMAPKISEPAARAIEVIVAGGKYQPNCGAK